MIDLDLVVKRLGRDVLIVQSVKERQTSLNNQLATIQESYVEQLDEKKRALNETTTEQQLSEYRALKRQASVQFQKVKNEAQQSIVDHRNAVIVQFREDVKPIAARIAAEKGLSMVVTKNDSVLFTYNPSVAPASSHTP